MKLPFQFYLEDFGVAVAAITGVLAARGKRVDLFGVIVLALVTALGGGTIRDCTIGDFPVFWVRNPSYVFIAAGAAVVTFYLERAREFPRSVLLVADAFALALFTIVGQQKALDFHVGSAISVAMGVITGVAGGVLRDLLLGEIPLVFRPEIHLYATAAFAGAVANVLLARWSPTVRTNMMVGIAAILAMRLAGIRWHLSLPVYDPRQADETQPRGPAPPQA
jgi:uncharacterized membrane protein YeiH